MHDGADVVQVERLHVSDPPGGVLERHQAHVEVDLIQVSAVEGVELERIESEPAVAFQDLLDKWRQDLV